MGYNIDNGIDIFLQQIPGNRRMALLTNNAAVTATFRASRQALLDKGHHLVKLFSPEHGLDTTGADGHIMYNSTDTITGLPVISLYGDKLAPGAEDLEDIDILLADLPDIGSRFYTYLWTMTHVMESCARYNKTMIVLDRPNPLSGVLSQAEGPLPDEERTSSFIGRWKIPVRHSCTLGELALYFNSVKNIGCPLEVIPCKGWKRDMLQPDYQSSFVPASPAINTFEAALLYPGLCMLEASNISEGRGTAVPFRVAGAPWIDPVAVAETFNNAGMKHVYAREISFTPEAGRYKAQSCKGVMLHVTSPCHFQPVKTGLVLLMIIRSLHPGYFEWAPYMTHVNRSGNHHLDLLTGIPDAVALFEGSITDFINAVDNFTNIGNWQQEINPYLLYH